MNIVKSAGYVSTIVAILALAAALHEYRAAQAAARNLSDALLQSTQLRRQLAETRASHDKDKQLIEQLNRRNEQGAAPQSVNPDRQVKIVHLSDIMKEHPEFAALHAKDMRRRTIHQYGASLIALNLPADQLAKAKNLLVERDMSRADAVQAAQANGIAQGSPEWRTAIAQASEGVTQDLNSLLQTYANTSLSQLDLLNDTRASFEFNFAPDFVDAGLPLSEAQAQAIEQAGADASYRSPNAQPHPPNYNIPDPTTGITPKQNQMINQVAPVLTPAQLEIYKTSMLESMQLQAINNEYTNGGPTIIMP